MPTLFVTGTDTGAGKTTVAVALIRALQAHGARVLGFKPVASGAQAALPGGELRSADALLLQAAGSEVLPYAWINPYVFAAPIAPHLAAAAVGVTLDWSEVRAAHAQLAARADWVVAEGAGGWLLPWDAHQTLGDKVAQAGWPVVLVVGVRLGCLNHALLTAEAILARHCRLLAWVANVTAPDTACVPQQIATLKARLPAPLLLQLNYGQTAAAWLEQGSEPRNLK